MSAMAVGDLLRWVREDVIERFGDEGLSSVLLPLLDDVAASPTLRLLAVLTAAGVGVLHALGPGHGKLLIGSYLAGTRGRARDAVALGVLVGLMHTASVLALGLLFHATARAPGETLQRGLSLVSALAITAVGVVLVRRRLRARRVGRPVSAPALQPAGGPTSDHDHADHHHAAHEHADHHHLHADHHHALPHDVPPLSRAGVLALATGGGLLPSPAAFALLVAALAVGRSGDGLALVAAFGIGLAATLTAVGLVVVAGRDRLGRRAVGHPVLAGVARAVPTLGAVAVLLGGIALTATSVLAW